MDFITYIIICDNGRKQQIINYCQDNNLSAYIINDKNSINLDDILSTKYAIIDANNNRNIDYLIKTAKVYRKGFSLIKDKICIISLCYNEIKILPFALEYWKRIAGHAIVYDNGSTDGSVEYLLKQNDFVELKSFRYKEDNKINDEELRNFKNNIWKEYKDKYDWVIVCDIDEFLYIKNVDEFLYNLENNNIALVKPQGYQLISIYFPDTNIPDLLHNELKYGVRDKMFDKCVMFNTHKVEEINFDYGCHKCHPKIIDGAIYQKNDIYLFHAKWLTWQYVDEKYKSVQNKLSRFNIERGFGIEYQNNSEMIRQTFMNLIDRCEFISDWYNENIPAINDNTLNDIEKVKPVNNRLCIYVQLYKPVLSDEELISLEQLCYVVNNKYDIILSCPYNFNTAYYQDFINLLEYQNIQFVNLPEIYYQSIETYNQLCLSWKFYNIFSYYDYMLVYQLDSIIYYDNLEYFMSLNYDFIGAPHNSPYRMCGNGGFSLRKVKSMINILRNTDIDYTIFEDIFINSKIINAAPLNVCRMFSISWPKQDEFSAYIPQPMGEHYVEFKSIK